MKTKVIVIKPGEIKEEEVELQPKKGDVVVDVKYCGVCKSDIRVYYDEDPFFSSAYSGHEGVGIVVESYAEEFKVGDIVATYWHPCFTTRSVWQADKCIRVLYCSPEYVLQPLSCVVDAMWSVNWTGVKNVLVLGSGYFALLLDAIKNTFYAKVSGLCNDANWEFFGSYNKDKLNITSELKESYYDVVFDVSGRHKTIKTEVMKERGQYVVVANGKVPLSLDSWQASWKNLKIIFPSPRSKSFRSGMEASRTLVGDEQFKKVLTKLYTVIKPHELELYMKNYRNYVKAVVDFAGS